MNRFLNVLAVEALALAFAIAIGYAALYIMDYGVVINLTVLKKQNCWRNNIDPIYVNLSTNPKDDIRFNDVILHFENGMLVEIEEVKKEDK